MVVREVCRESKGGRNGPKEWKGRETKVVRGGKGSEVI